MLTRKQIEVKASEAPSTYNMVRRACENLRKTVPNEYCASLSDDELRLRFTEEAALSWIESYADRDDRLSRFLKTLGFDWGDVRELKEATFDPAIEIYREELISEAWHTKLVSGYTASEAEDARTAMKLIERWFTQAIEEHGDCIEEFICAHAEMMSSIDTLRVNTELMLRFHRLRSFSEVIRLSVLIQWVFGTAWALTGNELIRDTFFMMATANLAALIIDIVFTILARRQLNKLCYFKPSRKLSGKQARA